MEEFCGTCTYHKFDTHGLAWVCTNADSEYVADYTEHDDGCDEWEGKDED